MFLEQAGSLPHGDQLVVGLNPPFGVNNKLAIQFIQESCKFQPRVIVRICSFFLFECSLNASWMLLRCFMNVFYSLCECFRTMYNIHGGGVVGP
jgi:hypothetical protein